MDFTIKTYRSLLKGFIKQGYDFQTFQEFLEESAPIMEQKERVRKKRKQLYYVMM